MTFTKILAVAGVMVIASQALNALASPTLEGVITGPQLPASINPGDSAAYMVTVLKSGTGMLDAYLTISGLPPEATGSFEPAVLGFTGQAITSLNSTLTISTTNSIAPGTYPFIVTAREGSSHKFKTASGNLVVGGNQPVRPLLSIHCLSEGQVRLDCTAQANRAYEIQVTSDLASPAWTTLCTNSCDINGVFSFIDSDTANYPMRFYRAAACP